TVTIVAASEDSAKSQRNECKGTVGKRSKIFHEVPTWNTPCYRSEQAARNPRRVRASGALIRSGKSRELRARRLSAPARETRTAGLGGHRCQNRSCARSG